MQRRAHAVRPYTHLIDLAPKERQSLCLRGEVRTTLLRAYSVRPYTHLIDLTPKERQGSGFTFPE